MKDLGNITWWLMVAGAVNWGLALFGLNLVTSILGGVPILVTVVYALIGLSGVYALAEKFGMV